MSTSAPNPAPERRYVIPLEDPLCTQAVQVGHKAANLARMLAAGFPVPQAVVLTTEAFEAFASGDGQGASAPRDGQAPPDLDGALRQALARFGDAPLAVRSSGVAEDLAGASFAGQYETVLDVRGPGAVHEAVRRCWASASGAHVSTYRAQQGAESGSMAVLIQELIPADAAGVAFTANPVTGERSETVVSAVRGLGERLVSGHASPDEWIVRDGQAICRAAPEEAVGAAEVKAVAELARRVEAHFGAPQDIEWAYRGGRLYLLQARPITTLPDPAPDPVAVPVVPPAEGFWEREASHYPLPLSPIARTTFLPIVNRSFRRVFEEFPMLLETLELREVGGLIYQRLVPLGGKDRTPPPAWLAPLLFRIVPPIRRQIQACEETLQSDKHGRTVERWYSQWKGELIGRTTPLREASLPALTDTELERHAAANLALMHDAVEIHMVLNVALNLVLAEFFFGCRDLLGWDAVRALELVNGLSETSSEPARRLAALARQARANTAVAGLLQKVDQRTSERIAEADPGFAEAFAQYVREFGCRAIRYEPADFNLDEMPEMLLGLLRDQLVRGYDPEADAQELAVKRATAAAEARAALSGRPEDLARFNRILFRAERAYPVREEHGFYDAGSPLALLRRALLEAGRRLAERGQIAAQEDIFFLEYDEVREALRGGGSMQALATRHKGERAWVLAHGGPPSYGKPPAGEPPFAALPPTARFAHEAIMWIMNQIFAAQSSNRRQEGGGAGLTGIPAAAGAYTGRVRVIRDESEFDKIQVGDVLVCPITSPVWSVLFPSVGALVTDTGGILSHSAIIAREYRIPAVVATGNATELLRDGQMVTVDGAAGTVSVLPD